MSNRLYSKRKALGKYLELEPWKINRVPTHPDLYTYGGYQYRVLSIEESETSKFMDVGYSYTLVEIFEGEYLVCRI